MVYIMAVHIVKGTQRYPYEVEGLHQFILPLLLHPSQIASTTNRSPSDVDDKLNRRASLIFAAVILISAYLILLTIGISVLYSYSIEMDPELTWPELTARMMFDTGSTMVLLILCLATNRYNRCVGTNPASVHGYSTFSL